MSSKSSSPSSHSIEGRYVSSETAKKRVERAVMGASRSCASLEDYARRIVYETKCIESKIALTHEAFLDVSEETSTSRRRRRQRKKGRRKRTAAAPVSTGETRSTESGGSARRASPRRRRCRQDSAHVMHTVAHIELNAIDLAWDTVARFRGLPKAFYLDFARVADDESRHLSWCLQRLEELGHEYGRYGRARHVVVGMFRKSRR